MEKNNNLEKRIAKSSDPIICEFNSCVIRGSYYKCYFDTYQKCALYLDWLVTKNNRIK